MGVNHFRRNARMPEEFLNGPDVGSTLNQVRCERVPERMRGDPLGELRLRRSISDRTLQDRLVQVISPAFTCRAVQISPGCREEPLPR